MDNNVIPSAFQLDENLFDIDDNQAKFFETDETEDNIDDGKETPDKPLEDEELELQLTSDDESGKDGDDVVGDPTAKVAYDILVEKNVLPELEDFDNTFESLEKAMEQLPNIVADQLVKSSPTATQKLLEYAFALGDEATEEKLKDFFSTTQQGVPEEDISQDADKLRDFMFSEYKAKMPDMDAEDIDSILDRLEDNGKLVKRGQKMLEAKESLKTQQADNKIEEAREAQRKAKVEREQFQQGFDDELKRLKWSKTKMAAIQEQYDAQVVNDKLATMYKDPKAYLQLLNFLTYFDNKEKNFNFDGFSSSIGTEKTRSSMMKDRFRTSISKGGFSPMNSNKTKFDEEFYKNFRPI